MRLRAGIFFFFLSTLLFRFIRIILWLQSIKKWMIVYPRHCEASKSATELSGKQQSLWGGQRLHRAGYSRSALSAHWLWWSPYQSHRGCDARPSPGRQDPWKLATQRKLYPGPCCKSFSRLARDPYPAIAPLETRVSNLPDPRASIPGEEPSLW